MRAVGGRILTATVRLSRPAAIGPPTRSVRSTTRSMRWRGSIRGAPAWSSYGTSAASAWKRRLKCCGSLPRASCETGAPPGPG